ncbi:MAG: hypothetical protein ACOCT9_00810, partial [archaeon]
LCTTFAAVIFYNGGGTNFTPMSSALLFSPLVFYLFFKAMEKENKQRLILLLVIILIAYPFFHPAANLIIIISIFLICFISYFINNFFPESLFNDISSHKKTDYNHSFKLLMIMLFTWIPYVLHFEKFQKNIALIFRILLTGHSPSVQIQEIGEGINKLNLTSLDFFKLLFLERGISIIIIILTLSSFIMLIRKSRRKYSKKLFILIIISFFMAGLYSAEIFGILTFLTAVATRRFFRFFLILAPIIVVPSLFLIINYRKIRSMFVILLLLIATLGIQTAFTSPITYRPNPQVTRMEIRGAEWHVTHKDMNYSETRIMTPFYRFEEVTVGSSLAGERALNRPKIVPDHFNYSNYEQLYQSYNQRTYMFISEYDKTIYDTVWQEVDRFDKSDFYKVENDPSVNKVYNNGECNIWIIKG